MSTATHLTALVAISCVQISAQALPKLSVRTSECANRWIVFPDGSEQGQFQYGFVYIDEQAGFTFHAAGHFRVGPEGRAVAIPEEFFDKKASFKIRIERNGAMTLMSKELQKQLGLPDKPEWMKFYDDGSNSVHHRVRLGFWYNHLGDSESALPPLESAYKEQPAAEGLEFELSYAYNALKRYDKAIQVLAEAVRRDPKNIFLGSELAYTYLNMGKFKEAVEKYIFFISMCPDNNLERKSEMAMNLSQAYGQLGDQENQKKWLASAKIWAPEGSAVSNFFKQSL
jgi:tetratricopeptide (TPR) repeat protein